MHNIKFIGFLRYLMVAGVAAASSLAWGAPNVGKQMLHDHVPAILAKMQAIGGLPATQKMDLIFTLPLRNQDQLTTSIQQLYDPTSPSFHHFLTPPEFTKAYGPTEKDYQSVMDFVRANGFTVVGTHANRTLLDVKGAVSDIERTLHIHMRVFNHPTEARTFYAPDVEPSVDLDTPLLRIGGLDNLNLPHPKLADTSRISPGTTVAKGTGSDPLGDGYYFGKDFRAAYAPGVTLNGAGQTVAIMSLFGPYLADIQTYESKAGISPPVPVKILPIPEDGETGAPYGTGNGSLEAALDPQMVIAMAPGLSQLVIYEGTSEDDIFNYIANDTVYHPCAITSSYGQDGTTDSTLLQILKQYAMQGQTCFIASGDSGAVSATTNYDSITPYATLVGGSVLTTSGPVGTWTSETGWSGSFGGISENPSSPIPAWQTATSMATNQGSTTTRNLPDVALTATSVFFYANNGSPFHTNGTSIAAPLWAGFCALIDQQCAALGKPSVGFLNPAIYGVGNGPIYTSAFHDIQSGSNFTTASPTKWTSVPGYDLVTGWGTPYGMTTINAFASFGGTTWVKFGATATGANGTYTNPFNTLAIGVSNVKSGGTIGIIGPGSSSETMLITKPMIIESVNGAAEVGH